MTKPPAIPGNNVDAIETIGLEPKEAVEQVISLQPGKTLPEHVSDIQLGSVKLVQELPHDSIETIAEGAEQKDIPISSLVEEEKPDKITSLAQLEETEALEQFTAHGNQ
ncbi:MAG: hypothetical protein WAX66_04600 [Patescibacteria group bacterium]